MIPRSNQFTKCLYLKFYQFLDPLSCLSTVHSRNLSSMKLIGRPVLIKRFSSTQPPPTPPEQKASSSQQTLESKTVDMIKEAVSKGDLKAMEPAIDGSSPCKQTSQPIISESNLTGKQDAIADVATELNITVNQIEATVSCKSSKPGIESEEKKVAKKETKGHKKAVKKRIRVDLTSTSMERNFITPAKAMSDFALKPKDLECLKATKRRSPYEGEPLINVYWRKDVEAKAIEVWGSKENLMKELLKRELERKLYVQSMFSNKRRLRDYRREVNMQTEMALRNTSGLFGSSGKVVLTAVAINGSNFLFKLLAWMYTGSHCMFSESIHSLADTINQLILAFGIHKSVQRADAAHPYGYSNMRYVASLISGVGIFCVGTGLSLYHGVTGLLNPQPSESYFWAFCILAGSLVSEGATLMVAVNSIKKGAKESGMTFREYVFRGQDPSVNVVLFEDIAAVLGVGVAASCMALTSVYQSHVPDAIGSLIIGGLLGTVASFIIYTNVAALVGRSIPQELLERINAELEKDVMIRAIHDVKGIDMGNSLIRYKAELDFDGRELARSYLDHQDLQAMLEEVKGFKNVEELEAFILRHSECIIDNIGSEIDRIEMKLRTKFPEIRHCDLEIL